MKAMFKEEVEVAIADGGLEFRLSEIGGVMSAAFVTAPAGTDLRPALGGSTTASASAPTGATCFKGQVRIHTASGPQEYESGQAFYWGPGHAPEVLEDAEYVEFSPTAEMNRVVGHLK